LECDIGLSARDKKGIAVEIEFEVVKDKEGKNQYKIDSRWVPCGISTLEELVRGIQWQLYVLKEGRYVLKVEKQ
jgi:hypothetical protein